MPYKEWLKVTHAANMQTVVTVTIQVDNLTVRWSVRSYTSKIKEGVAEARKGARKAMTELQTAARELADVSWTG